MIFQRERKSIFFSYKSSSSSTGDGLTSTVLRTRDICLISKHVLLFVFFRMGGGGGASSYFFLL